MGVAILSACEQRKREDGISSRFIPDTADSQAFIGQVKEVFAHDPDFVLTESQAARVSHLGGRHFTANRPNGPSDTERPADFISNLFMKAETALEEIVNPAVEVSCGRR